MMKYNLNPSVKKEIGKKKANSKEVTSVHEKVLLDKARAKFFKDL